MRFFDNYTHIVATKEMSNGNESVGDMWVETKVFAKETPIDVIIQWAKHTGGKLIITISEPENKS
jgi:hypothetical protein